MLLLVGALFAASLYVPPVDAPVIDPFRPPDHAYGPGNLGWEYDTRPGASVRAASAGTVGHAGQVGGVLWVTILHPDGLLTSYGHLERVSVRRGQPVATGAEVGRAGSRLHFGVRAGKTYVDPALLFGADAGGTGPGRPRLVPPRPWNEVRSGPSSPASQVKALVMAAVDVLQ